MSEYHFVVLTMYPNIPLCCDFLPTHINLSEGLLPVLESQGGKHFEAYLYMLVDNSPIV
jgi:hypothetical protein